MKMLLKLFIHSQAVREQMQKGYEGNLWILAERWKKAYNNIMQSFRTLRKGKKRRASQWEWEKFPVFMKNVANYTLIWHFLMQNDEVVCIGAERAKRTDSVKSYDVLKRRLLI